jgi:hypothetical protein
MTASAATRTRALWIGPGAARALHGAGEVEFALHPGGYVRFGGGYALLAHPRAPRGPLTVLVAGLEASPLRPGDSARVDGALHVGEHEIALDVAPAATPPPPPLSPGWRAALTAALAAAPVPPPELAPGLAALRAGDLDRAVTDLAGRGPGLTPAGDDILAGYAAWHKKRIKGTVPIMSPLGTAYLRCAERGELPEPVARVVRAIRRGDVVAARRAARALGAWGASSGAAMLWGLASAT